MIFFLNRSVLFKNKINVFLEHHSLFTVYITNLKFVKKRSFFWGYIYTSSNTSSVSSILFFDVSSGTTILYSSKAEQYITAMDALEIKTRNVKYPFIKNLYYL